MTVSQSNKTLSTDVAVIGAGPVGLFAVFELGMLKMKSVVIDALPALGGQCTALYPEKPIYDIPAYPSVDGAELIKNLEAQAAPFDPHYVLGEQVVKLERLATGHWSLTTDKGTAITARAVIIAAGCGAFGPNRPPLAGIEQYENTSVHYMVARREDFRGKRLVIAGGGDSAVDWAVSLADVAEKIYVVHRRDKFRAAPEMVSKMQSLAESGKIEMVVPYQLEALEGDGKALSAVIVKSMNGTARTLDAQHLLAFFGLSMELGPLADWGLALDTNRITVAHGTCETSAEGIYAIGDIATYPHKLKLILCGFAEAAHAAHAIYNRLNPDTPLHFEYSTSKGVPA